MQNKTDILFVLLCSSFFWGKNDWAFKEKKISENKNMIFSFVVLILNTVRSMLFVRFSENVGYLPPTTSFETLLIHLCELTHAGWEAR